MREMKDAQRKPEKTREDSSEINNEPVTFFDTISVLWGGGIILSSHFKGRPGLLESTGLFERGSFIY